jgi:hypothetical protein
LLHNTKNSRKVADQFEDPGRNLVYSINQFSPVSRRFPVHVYLRDDADVSFPIMLNVKAACEEGRGLGSQYEQAVLCRVDARPLGDLKREGEALSTATLCSPTHRWSKDHAGISLAVDPVCGGKIRLGTLPSVGNLSLALFHRPCPDELFMILAAYIDESGTHGSPLMVIAGYVGSVSQWHDFDQNRSRLLQEYGVSHLHAVNLRHRNREFQGWSAEKAAQFAEAAETICDQHTMFGFAAVMNIEDYKRNYADGHKPRKIPLDTKYGVCFRACLSYLPMAILREVNRDDVSLNVTLEAGHPNTGDATRLFGLFKKQADPSRRLQSRTKRSSPAYRPPTWLHIQRTSKSKTKWKC